MDSGEKPGAFFPACLTLRQAVERLLPSPGDARRPFIFYAHMLSFLNVEAVRSRAGHDAGRSWAARRDLNSKAPPIALAPTDPNAKKGREK
jgi:hypothetical protein